MVEVRAAVARQKPDASQC